MPRPGISQTSMQVLRRAAAAHQVDLLTGIHGRTRPAGNRRRRR
jgi:hypothetical protein